MIRALKWTVFGIYFVAGGLLTAATLGILAPAWIEFGEAVQAWAEK